MSLRAKVIFGVLLIDLLIFGVLAFLIPLDLRRQETTARETRRTLLSTIFTLSTALPESAEKGPDLASILAWENWDYFDDALLMEGEVAKTPLVERRPIRAYFQWWFSWPIVLVEFGDQTPPGLEPIPIGMFFNPLGRFNRGADFDYEQAKRHIGLAIDTNQVIETDSTITVPVIRGQGDDRVSWGCHFILKEKANPILAMKGILLLTLSSMILLSLVTYFALSRLVLRPVESLARASRQVASGDLGVSLPVPPKRDEIAELVKSFDDMVARLRDHQGELRREVKIATEKAQQVERDLMTAQRLASMGTLASGIAHEINNPLAGMLNAIRSLQSKDLDPARKVEYLELVLNGLKRVQVTVSRVLQFSPREKTAEEIDLAAVIETARGLIGHRLSRENVTLEARVAPEARIRGSAQEFEQMFLNLFLNSLDALASRPPGEARQPGRIEVEIQVAEEVLIRVQDNGAGMDPSLVPRALDPFFTTKEVGKGTGLGLSIVFAIVRGAGGKLEIRTEPGKGFTITIHLPRGGISNPSETPG